MAAATGERLRRAWRGVPVRIVIAIGAALPASAAVAHHSVARFDRSNPIAVTGTLKQFIWANPHTWIYVMVPNGKGGEDEWDLEGPAVNGLARSGWKPSTLQPGMKVRLKVSPRRDHHIGGEFTTVLDVNDKPFVVSR